MPLLALPNPSQKEEAFLTVGPVIGNLDPAVTDVTL